MLPRRDKRGYVGRIGDTVDVDLPDARRNLFFHLFVANAVKITDRYVRLRTLSRLLQLEFEIGGLEAFSQQRHIGFDVLDKAFPRAFHRDIRRRFHYRANGQQLCPDDQACLQAIDEKEAVAVQHFGKDVLQLRLFLQLGKEKGLFHFFRGEALFLVFGRKLGERPRGEIAEQRFIHHAVGIDDGAFRAVPRQKSIDEDILRAQYRLDAFDIVFQFFCQFFHIPSMFLFSGSMYFFPARGTVFYKKSGRSETPPERPNLPGGYRCFSKAAALFLSSAPKPSSAFASADSFFDNADASLPKSPRRRTSAPKRRTTFANRTVFIISPPFFPVARTV